MPLDETAELRDPAFPVQLEIVEHQDPLRIERRFTGATHDQRTVQPAFHLHRLVAVRVVPERACVGQPEAIGERLARSDGVLDHLGAVHCRRHAQPMPVDGRRFRKVVRQAQFEDVADVRLDYGAGNLAVVPPSAHETARRVLPVRLAGFQFDRHHLAARVRLRSFIRFPPGGLRVDRGCMHMDHHWLSPHLRRAHLRAVGKANAPASAALHRASGAVLQAALST